MMYKNTKPEVQQAKICTSVVGHSEFASDNVSEVFLKAVRGMLKFHKLLSMYISIYNFSVQADFHQVVGLNPQSSTRFREYKS